MNKISLHIIPNKKAGFTACFFLWLVFFHTPARAQVWKFDEPTAKAYALALNLQTSDALALLPQPKTAGEHYVASLAQVIELLVTEDGEKYTEYESVYQKRLDRKMKSSSAEELFLQAELHLQWTFVYLKFGHEFDAALSLRQAYQITQDCKEKFPTFQAIKKTSGLIDVIIGAVPEKYDWVLSLLGMQGSIESGLDELGSIAASENPLAFESGILHALVLAFVLQKTDVAITEIKQLQQQYPGNRLALFIGAAVAIKNAQSEDALAMLKRLEGLTQGLPLYYSNYLMGEIYLQKADYLNSISAYHWFIKNYHGQNYIKDANYKIGLCYLLNGNTNDAQAAFKLAKNEGKEATEADRYAARSLAEFEPPNIKLTKARYFFDGGYYAEAGKILESITPAEIPTKRDQVEFYYRKARLAHKTNQLSAAKLFYNQTIDQNGDENWYYAPNSCLQLGYIAMADNDKAAARQYFTRALTYKKHEYKNSIDSKAKSALAQLSVRK